MILYSYIVNVDQIPTYFYDFFLYERTPDFLARRMRRDGVTAPVDAVICCCIGPPRGVASVPLEPADISPYSETFTMDLLLFRAAE